LTKEDITYNLVSMKVLMLYRPNSDHARQVEEYARDFMNQHGAGRFDMVDLNTRDGVSTASLYDVMQYPALLAVTDDGQLVKEWEGRDLPLMNELAYYTNI
jgi:hypothetical protein